jgi:RimJ/RimL family protein N-acetyltransferase
MEGAACLLAKRNDKDVGYVFLRRMSGNVFMLLNFGVATIFRRTGVGREMLTKLCDLAGDSGIIVTGCSVDDAPFNNLLSLCGFSFVGKRKDDEMGELNMYQFVGKELKNVLESE